MPSTIKIKSNLKGLDQLKENLKTNLVAKLGIFADDNSRSDGGLTNSEIGARHEFGVLGEGLPRRSFLKDPIEFKRKELLKTVEKIIRDNITKEDAPEKIFELIGIAGEAIVQEAFESGGFGQWQPLSDEARIKKGSSTILIDSSQLRRSVTSIVEKR
jgi:hypothetical protein